MSFYFLNLSWLILCKFNWICWSNREYTASIGVDYMYNIMRLILEIKPSEWPMLNQTGRPDLIFKTPTSNENDFLYIFFTFIYFLWKENCILRVAGQAISYVISYK